MSTQKPRVGEQVITLVDPEVNDGRDELAAIVTGDAGEGLVNLLALPDQHGHTTRELRQARLYNSRTEAEKALAEQVKDLPQPRPGSEEPKPTALTVTRWVPVAYRPVDPLAEQVATLRTEVSKLRSEVAALSKAAKASNSPPAS